MAEDVVDPRDVSWHPRRAVGVVGHDKPLATLKKAFQSGKMHHAWLLSGEEGIGKATLAYVFAKWALGQGQDKEQTTRWIESGSHPNLFVLQRKMTDRKPQTLKSEIAVDDARDMVKFFEQTSGFGSWRIAIVDAADDLNPESANALLKLVEEPPSKCLILLVSHRAGRLLRTLRSRCSRLPVETLSAENTRLILNRLPSEAEVDAATLVETVAASGGSPGKALRLMHSEGAKVFHTLLAERSFSVTSRLRAAKGFSQRGPNNDDFQIFGNLLLNWIAVQAKARGNGSLAEAYSEVGRSLREASSFNLDRKQASLELMELVEEALKPA
jgi:DNA polymerase III subunit delta'